MNFRSTGRRGRPSRNNLRLETLEDRNLLSITPGNPTPTPGPDPEAADGSVVHLPAQFKLFDYQGYLSAPSTQSPITIAEQYIRSNAASLGIQASDLNNYIVTTNYVTKETGATTLTFQQSLNGLPVQNANFNITVAANGQLLSVMGGFISGLSTRAGQISAVPAMNSTNALVAASNSLGLALGGSANVLSQTTNGVTNLTAPNVSSAAIVPKLQYTAIAGNDVRLAWNMTLRVPGGQHWYNVSVDSSSGKIVALGDYFSHATYEVFAAPTTDPEDNPRSIATDPHIFTPTPAIGPSPFGWHDTNGAAGAEFTTTQGNNVNAYTDRDADDVADAGSQPNGGANLDFTGPLVAIDLTQQPATYSAAAVVNLFYMNNFIHDVHYLYGFDEAARNFQVNNYGRGGVGDDAVNAEAQDGSGTDNANFGTPPDGESPTMQMFEFTGLITNTPLAVNRDGDFANEIIIHEYGHGVSNRLTGNGSGLFALQSGAMGEGWSDFWSLMLTQKTADETTIGRGTGMYALAQPQDGPGIRDFKYDFDITDPILETFESFNNGVIGSHDAGTRWCAVLWDLNKLLIDKYGFEPNVYNVDSDAGNIKALKLVMNGLKIQPLNPSFIDARDAILAADQLLFGGENSSEIWEAFARRGLGLDASTASSDSTTIILSHTTPIKSPVAVDDSAATTAAVPVIINVLANDSDPNTGGILLPSTVTIVTAAANGTTSVNPVTGIVTYTPSPNASGTDFFEYNVTSNFGKVSNRAKVTISINGLPVANNDNYNTAVGVAVTGNVLENDFDPEGPLNADSLEIVKQPDSGTISVSAGSITYTPNPGFEGGDTLKYRVKDSTGILSNIATVTFRVGTLHTLSGKVFVDLNNNGVMDGNDWPITGVRVFVEKTDGIYKFQDMYATEADGTYNFTDLVTGTYTLIEQHPAYFHDGIDTAGTPAPTSSSNDKFSGISLTGTTNGSGFNFAEAGVTVQFAAAFLTRQAFTAGGDGVSFTGIDLGKSDAWVAFDSLNGQLQASAFLASGGTATLTLYDKDMKQIAKSTTGSGYLTYQSNSNQAAFLKVSGTARDVSLSTFVIPPIVPPVAARVWRNATEPKDVNGDGKVVPADILVLIDAINRFGVGSLTDRAIESSHFLDVDGDGMLLPADILAVIDHVNRNSSQTAQQFLSSTESSESSSASSGDASSDIAFALAVNSVLDDSDGGMFSNGKRKRA